MDKIINVLLRQSAEELNNYIENNYVINKQFDYCLGNLGFARENKFIYSKYLMIDEYHLKCTVRKIKDGEVEMSADLFEYMGKYTISDYVRLIDGECKAPDVMIIENILDGIKILMNKLRVKVNKININNSHKNLKDELCKLFENRVDVKYKYEESIATYDKMNIGRYLDDEELKNIYNVNVYNSLIDEQVLYIKNVIERFIIRTYGYFDESYYDTVNVILHGKPSVEYADYVDENIFLQRMSISISEI